MANQNIADFIPSGANTIPVLSDDESVTIPSAIESLESLSDKASQPDSLSDEPYHELFQLMQQGAPPQVHWTCVKCEAKFPSSGGLLDHHVTACAYRNISSTAVFSTTTVVALLKRVDPEHPVDGERVWWVDTGKDEGDSEDIPSEGEEPKEEANKEVVREAPVWLTAEQKREWEKRKDRLIKIQSLMRIHKHSNGRFNVEGAMAEWNQTFGRLPGYPRYTNPRSFTCRYVRSSSRRLHDDLD